MASISPLMLADQSRAEQFTLLGGVSGLLRDHTIWTDGAGLPWAGNRIGGHWFVVAGLGPGWVFDPCGRRHHVEELARLQDELNASFAELPHRLNTRISQLHFGPKCERICWSIYRRALETKRSVFQIPDIQLRHRIWGRELDASPKNWRSSIRRWLESLGWLHLASPEEADTVPELGRMTAILTHFADLRGSSNDQCEEDCPARGGSPHHHFLINIGRGFLGCLEQCSDVDDENGIRHYDFPARGSRETGANLKQLGRGGNLRSLYLPARLGEPAQCNTLTANQHRLLQAVFREMTRRRRNQRREYSEPEVITGTSVPDAQGRNNILCPHLDGNKFVGFNGNGKRRGCGYCFTTEGGWLVKAGYAQDDVLSFLTDLSALSRRLGLTVVGLVPGTHPHEWLTFDRMIYLARQSQRNALVQKANLRIYAPAGFENHWNELFGWPPPSLLTPTTDDDQRAEAAKLLEQSGAKRVELAIGIGMDRSLLSKILNGKRKCPDGFLNRVRQWFQSRCEPPLPAENDNTTNAVASTVCGIDTSTLHSEVAMTYLSRGWSIIPQVPRTKKPHVKWKPFQDRLPTETEIESWWSQWPDAGMAIIPGRLSGILVVDVDGSEAHDAMMRHLGVEPIAPKVLSGSRAPHRYHLFFQHPDFSTGAKKTPWHPKLEFRGHAGLTVLPPSLHKSGNRYVWAPGQSLDDLCPPDLPAEIVEALRPVNRSNTTTTAAMEDVSDLSVSDSTREFLSGAFADGSGWNSRLFRAACDLAGRGVALDQAELLLLEAARPWNDSERDQARRTIASAYSQSREPALL